jgi:hypothetical protein
MHTGTHKHASDARRSGSLHSATGSVVTPRPRWGATTSPRRVGVRLSIARAGAIRAVRLILGIQLHAVLGVGRRDVLLRGDAFEFDPASFALRAHHIWYPALKGACLPWRTAPLALGS